jgi:FkbM family methyltransferase
VKPNYQIVNKLNEKSIVVDLGTGEDADFSQDLIQRFGLRVFGFEPTRKHHDKLDSVVRRTKGHFEYFKYAIADTDEKRIFFESLTNVSGSFFKDHINIKRDKIRSYEVSAIRFDRIFDILKIDHVDLLKMDIEGGEYAVFASASVVTLRKIDQIVVEFHHDTIDRFSLADTDGVIHALENVGFESYTEDYTNYLFFRT